MQEQFLNTPTEVHRRLMTDLRNIHFSVCSFFCSLRSLPLEILCKFLFYTDRFKFTVRCLWSAKLRVPLHSLQTLLYLCKIHEFLSVFAELQLVLYHSRALEYVTILFPLAATQEHPFLQSLDPNMLSSLMSQWFCFPSQLFTLFCWDHSTLGIPFLLLLLSPFLSPFLFSFLSLLFLLSLLLQYFCRVSFNTK